MAINKLSFMRRESRNTRVKEDEKIYKGMEGGRREEGREGGGENQAK